MKKPQTVIATIILIFMVSCKNTGKQTGISSGRIDYKISYLNHDLDKKARNILPTRMKLMFNEKQASNIIEGFMGMYKLNVFTNFHSRKCSTILKVFDKNYVLKGGRNEQMCCFDAMEGMEIEETKDTKIIAGFNCKKAIIRLPGRNETFTIYYTEEIALKHPNSTNPYSDINGVLMEFELNLLYLRMRFVAEKFQSCDEAELLPKFPDNSKEVSRNQMTEILNRLLEL